MTNSTQTPTTVSNIGVVMFTVADQDAALAFYTEKLGFEVRGDSSLRRERRAPLAGGRAARIDRPPGAEPADEQPARRQWHRRGDARRAGEHARLSAIGGIDIDPEPMRAPGAPLLFMLRDPDGNHIAVVEVPPAS